MEQSVPNPKGQGGDRHDAIGKITRHAIGKVLDRRFTGLSRFH